MFRKFLSRFKVKSSEYWNNRYRQGGNSGQGSYGKLADFKKKVLDDFCKKNDIHSIIEFGSGDGNQISLLEYENVYIGLDISPAAIELCRQRFKNDKGKSFFVFSGKKGFCKQNGLTAELSLSLDVLYHLVEDKIFSNYMHELFSSAEKFVIIYSSNDENQKDSSWHVKHRNFSKFVESEFPQFTLLEHIPNEFPIGNPSGEESSADFFIYIRNN